MANIKDETYYFHQTPEELAKRLIALVPLVADDIVLEPFRGEGAFYNNLPNFVNKQWTEITEGRDYKSFDGLIDYVITNPPFRLENGNNGRVNSFWYLLKYYSTRVNKGICFLANDYCFGTLTPNRLKELNSLGWYLKSYTVCNVKKWRGRYYFIQFTKQHTDFAGFIEGSF
jgi:hypothetical protein